MQPHCTSLLFGLRSVQPEPVEGVTQRALERFERHVDDTVVYGNAAYGMPTSGTTSHTQASEWFSNQGF